MCSGSEISMSVNHAEDIKIFVVLKLLKTLSQLLFLTLAFEMKPPSVHIRIVKELFFSLRQCQQIFLFSYLTMC